MTDLRLERERLARSSGEGMRGLLRPQVKLAGLRRRGWLSGSRFVRSSGAAAGGLLRRSRAMVLRGES